MNKNETMYKDEENQTLDQLVEEGFDKTDVGQEENTSSSKGILSDLIFFGILIFVCIYIIPTFVLQRTIVDGSSMETNLSDGDHLYVEKISYRFDKLDRYDIIVFYPYGRDHEEYYVKRIIGMPGETVQIIDGFVYINGEPLDEHYGKDIILEAGVASEPMLIAEDEYFVLGDNRNSSKDSRQRSVGNVNKENIGGKAFLRIKPFGKFGLLD